MMSIITVSGESPPDVTKQSPVGLLGTNALLCPHFLFLGNGPHSASTAFPKFQRTGLDSCCSGKEGGAKTREEEPRNNSTALGQDPGSLSEDTHDDTGILHT